MNVDGESEGRGNPGRLVEADVICFERLLPGPIERVWAHLTDSGKRARWLASGVMEPRVGAPVALEFRHAALSPRSIPTPSRYRAMDRGCTTHHTITRYEPPHLLAMTWGGGSEPLSEVTFELSDEHGQVRLLLTHRRLSGDSLRGVASGWHAHLAILGAVLSERAPEPFWTPHDGAERIYAELEDRHGTR